MVDRFAAGHAAVVAAHAGGRNAFENATLVAGFAGDFDVHAFKRKAGDLVVEILVNLEIRVRCFGQGASGKNGHDEPERRDKCHGHLQKTFCSAVQQVSIYRQQNCRPQTKFNLSLNVSENYVNRSPLAYAHAESHTDRNRFKMTGLTAS